MLTYANTLDADFQMKAPGTDFDSQLWRNNHLEFPVGGHRLPRKANTIRPMMSDDVDWKAPGVREHMMNPPISLGPYRSSVYDTQRAANQAPMPPYEPDRVGSNTLLFGPWAQAYSNSIYEIVNENKVLEHESNSFRNVGTWSGPRTGFSALSELRPTSSLVFM